MPPITGGWVGKSSYTSMTDFATLPSSKAEVSKG